MSPHRMSLSILYSSLLLSVFVFLYVSPEVTVTSLHPPRLCRLAVFSIKPDHPSPLSYLSHISLSRKDEIHAISLLAPQRQVV